MDGFYKKANYSGTEEVPVIAGSNQWSLKLLLLDQIMEVEISLSIVSWNFHFCDFKFSLHLSNSIYQLFCSDTHSFSVCLSLLLSQNFPKLTTNSCKVLVLENMDVLRTISSQVKYYHKFFFSFVLLRIVVSCITHMEQTLLGTFSVKCMQLTLLDFFFLSHI